MTDTFWDDLKRRRVFRIGAAYVAVSYAFLEGADLVLPRIGLPDRVLTVLVVATILGFPLVLVGAWIYEVTPRGLVRTAAGGPADGSPARRRRLESLALGLATLLFAAGAWLWIPRSPAFRTVELDPEVLVVLPFDVRGSEDVAYLREGMVDLLSAKLDEVGGLRVVDPQATLAGLRETRRSELSSEEAFDLAERFRAGRVLQGSVVWVTGALQVRAVVRGPGQDDETVASVEGPADDLFSLLDELVRELVARGLLASRAPLSSLEGLTTSSNEALRLYLQGIQDFRLQGGTRENFDLLTRALAVDSTFALAAYWAGYVAAFSEITDPVPYFEQAVRHQDRLRPLDRARLAAALAGARGRHAEAIRLYSRLVERSPDDVASWFQLGEQLAHTGHYSGRRLAEARPVYERALALDPGLTPAYYHLAQLLGLERDTLGLATWAARGEAVGVDPGYLSFLLMMRSLILEDRAGAEPGVSYFLDVESSVPPATVAGSLAELMGAILEVGPAYSTEVLGDFARRALTDTARVVATRRLSRHEAGAGRFRTAGDAVRALRPVSESLYAQDLSWLALRADSGATDRTREAFRALEASRVPAGGAQAAARSYLLALLALRTGDDAAAARARDELESLAGSPPEIDRFAADLSLELDALAALREGRPAEALAALERASYWETAAPWAAVPPDSYFYGTLPDRRPMFLRAEILRAAGHDTAAMRWYEVTADGTWDRAPALLALGEIHEARGEAAPAAASYRRLLALWSDADPELAESRRRVEARLTALAAELD